MKIVNTQRPITLKAGKPELPFMLSACCLMVFNILSSFMKICQAVLKLYGEDTKIVNTQRAITPKVGKPELKFMGSARRPMVFNICMKFHENMSSGSKVMERTQKMLTHKGQ